MEGVVFQGEIGAPGARGDKGEKVSIGFFCSELLRPGEGSLCVNRVWKGRGSWGRADGEDIQGLWKTVPM